MYKKNRSKFFLFYAILIISFVSSHNLTTISAKEMEVKQRKIITFKDYVSKADIDKTLNEIHGEKIKNLGNTNGVVAYLTNNQKDLIINNPVISYIEDDIKVNLLSKPMISDKPTPLQPSEILPWGVDNIDAEKTFTVDTSSIKIAIIDSGIDISHPDLVGNLKGGFNAINPKLSYNDDNGHGTHVAGIIGAAKNTIGVVGVAPQVNIYAIKAFDSSGNGYLSDIIEGINWCIKNRINVINISFGANTDNQIFHDTITRAYQAGIVIVAAAGNDSSNIVNYPAAYPEVISVSAVDSSNNIAPFAPIGKVDVVAPGINIFSTYKDSIYGGLSGTSMASAHVTGGAAVLLSVPSKCDINDDGICSPYEMKKRIELTSTDLGLSGKDNIYGSGLINVYATIN